MGTLHENLFHYYVNLAWDGLHVIFVSFYVIVTIWDGLFLPIFKRI